MELFAVLPAYKPSSKVISIHNSEHIQVGHVQRIYKNTLNRVINHLPFSLLENTNIIGEQDDCYIELEEQSFKSNLWKLKWNVYVEKAGQEEVNLLKDLTKISTDPRLVYEKAEHSYMLKKEAYNGDWHISIEDSMFICAEIKVEKQLPQQIKITLNTEHLTAIEVLAMYYVMSLAY